MDPFAFTGLLVGSAYGYASQRGAFCMSSGFRVAATRRDFTKVKALLLAVALQAVLLPVLFAVGLPRPEALPFRPSAALVGGLVFGAAMKAAGGCAGGAWYKVGAGSVTALAAVAGIAVGAAVYARFGAFPGALAVSAAPWWLAPALGVVLLAALSFAAPGKAGAWSWQRTGAVVGLIALAAWPLSALTGRAFGVAVVPGAVALLEALLHPFRGAAGGPSPGLTSPDVIDTFSRWDVLFVLGIPAGAWAAARRDGPVRFRPTTGREVATALGGGVVLGASAALAGGCTVGHGLGGLPLVEPQSVVTMAAIFLGAAVIARWEQRRAATLAPAARSGHPVPLPPEARS